MTTPAAPEICCDLHMHSTASDGTCSPSELVAEAMALGLQAVALTDHDTFGGVAAMEAEARANGLRFIPGIELSVELADGGGIHMLGYCFTRGRDILERELERIIAGREARNRQIVTRLCELGLELTYDEVLAQAGGKIIGRPHFAAVMVRRGYVAEPREAFDKYLAKGKAAYFDRERFTAEQGISLIRECGGVAVLAHPSLLTLPAGQTLDDVIRHLADCGLGGIECYYSLHTPEQTNTYLAFARRYGLVVTGGSDYHGGRKPDIRMGCGKGDLRVPLRCADELEARAAQAA
ncbi:MAG: PHP domain-containing protein [Candidatus Sumerlaeaceae bacterium]|nr:PHP domain-containing protein [Candidatus Sumerlaeaceae bacterium]